MWWILLTGCIFGGKEAPPAPAPTVQQAPVVAPPAEPAPEPVTVNPQAAALLGDALARELAEATVAFESSGSAAEVAAAHTLAVALSGKLTDAFRDDDRAPGSPDVDLVAAAGPGLQVQWMAEGTVAVFSPAAEPWTAKAATTDGDVDDTFFALTTYVYDSAHTEGWAVWEMRNWDYGGCSGLGKGVVFESLKRAQAAAQAGDTFSADVAKVRGRAIHEITRTDPSQFQRCDVETVQPMATERLQAEAQQVLDDIELTEAERTAITAALPKLQGEVFQGG